MFIVGEIVNCWFITSVRLFHLAWSSSRYLDAGRDMVTSLQYVARCPCGYCHISDVEIHKQEDHMESFFLAETVRINFASVNSNVDLFSQLLLVFKRNFTVKWR